MDQATPGFLTCAPGSSSAARPDGDSLLAAGLGAAWECVDWLKASSLLLS